MPPTHPSQVAVAAAYWTLIAHETEPKEQDFYRDRLQRLEQATESVCEFDCCSRVAAAGVGVYCPQCSAKCADTGLATELAKAIRAAWVDRLDWDELAQGALEFLTTTGRLTPAGGIALTTEQVEDVRALVWLDGRRNFDAFRRLRALFPATEPAEHVHEQGAHYTKGHTKAGAWTVSTCRTCGAVIERGSEDGAWVESTDPPAPAEPAEEETKVEDGTLEALRDLFNGGPDTAIRTTWHDGAEYWEVPAEDMRKILASSPVVPASTETGPWPTWQEVPEGVKYRETPRRQMFGQWWWVNRNGIRHLADICGEEVATEIVNPVGPFSPVAPFVAAKEG